MSTIADVTKFLEQIAPRSLQESYDNSGLICGDASRQVTGVLVSLDAIETVVDEAIKKGVNLIVSHHPILFCGLTSLTGATYVERTILKAIKHDIALYAIHTNLDNVLQHGVNQRLAETLGLTDLSILAPNQSAAQFNIPVSALLVDDLMKNLEGELAMEVSRFNVQIKKLTSAVQVQGPKHIESAVAASCRQYQLDYGVTDHRSSKTSHIGAGVLGHTALPMTEENFLQIVKEKLQLEVIRHTALRGKSIEKVALCGGSGSFLLPKAIRAGADIFITADYKYHQFFDADDRIVIADVGHFESEQYTIDLLVDQIKGKFSNFAARSAETRTNPVYYFR